VPASGASDLARAGRRVEIRELEGLSAMRREFPLSESESDPVSKRRVELDRLQMAECIRCAVEAEVALGADNVDFREVLHADRARFSGDLPKSLQLALGQLSASKTHASGRQEIRDAVDWA